MIFRQHFFDSEVWFGKYFFSAFFFLSLLILHHLHKKKKNDQMRNRQSHSSISIFFFFFAQIIALNLYVLYIPRDRDMYSFFCHLFSIKENLRCCHSRLSRILCAMQSTRKWKIFMDFFFYINCRPCRDFRVTQISAHSRNMTKNNTQI